jgi:hypothetical protein
MLTGRSRTGFATLRTRAEEACNNWFRTGRRGWDVRMVGSCAGGGGGNDGRRTAEGTAFAEPCPSVSFVFLLLFVLGTGAGADCLTGILGIIGRGRSTGFGRG